MAASEGDSSAASSLGSRSSAESVALRAALSRWVKITAAGAVVYGGAAVATSVHGIEHTWYRLLLGLISVGVGLVGFYVSSTHIVSVPLARYYYLASVTLFFLVTVVNTFVLVTSRRLAFRICAVTREDCDAVRLMHLLFSSGSLAFAFLVQLPAIYIARKFWMTEASFRGAGGGASVAMAEMT